jgi:hypothetical protein
MAQPRLGQSDDMLQDHTTQTAEDVLQYTRMAARAVHAHIDIITDMVHVGLQGSSGSANWNLWQPRDPLVGPAPA